jgi:hypothetical protein
MFSKFIRLGALFSSAVILSSCGGGTGQTETQQSTPEGLFLGPTSIYINPTGALTTYTNPTTGAVTPCTVNTLMFVHYAGTFYSFFDVANPAQDKGTTQPTVIAASSGSLSYSTGVMNSHNVLQVTPPNLNGAFLPGSTTPNPVSPHGTYCGTAITSTNDKFNGVAQVNNEVTVPAFTGGYTTGVNMTGTFNYPMPIDALGTTGDYETATIGLNYNADYQGVQSLATLAGTYVGTVGTSQFSESATFTFSPASVPANSGNQYGVGLITGTGASGCTYTGTVSPLFKGNAYTTSITAGGASCQLATSQFSGLVYLDVANRFLYSFSPNLARTDGLIFTGKRN